MGAQKEKQTGYVPAAQKWSYSIASGGGNIITTIVGSFISAYLTDSVGIGVATVSTMMLVNRVFDLFSDFLMGSLVDKTHTKYGKARPWLALSAPLIALFLILLFSVPDGMGTWLAIFDNGGDVVAAISKRPDLRPILSILEEQGDEIISRADSIAFEIDMDKEIVKKVFALAEKYHKPVYAVVSNMSIAVERRDFFRSTHCFVCNQQEAGILFSEDYDDKTPEEMQRLLAARIRSAQIPRMVVTMGAQGAVYATNDGEEGWCPAKKVDVKDTTGAGDAFFAGVTIGLTYGKTMAEACEIGTRLAASVICTSENVCPRFLPSEFGIDPSGLEREQLSLEL